MYIWPNVPIDNRLPTPYNGLNPVGFGHRARSHSTGWLLLYLGEDAMKGKMPAKGKPMKDSDMGMPGGGKHMMPGMPPPGMPPKGMPMKGGKKGKK